MTLATASTCPRCSANLQDEGRIAVEYAFNDPHHFDGISEWRCATCGYREGRWTGRELTGDEYEPRYGGAG